MGKREENEQRLQAFLALIRYAEAGRRVDPDAYHASYGGQHFGGLHRHPGQPHTRWGKTSSAAGAYQITKETFEDAQQHIHIPDFSEKSQDEVALWLIARRHATMFIEEGNLSAALSLLNGTWSSLPGGASPEITEAEAEQFFHAQLEKSSP